jgi:arylsulfatase A-like enzyme
VAQPGRVVTQPVQLLDILPTVLRAAGQPVPAYADGYDLAPFLAGAAADPARPPIVASQNADEDISSSWFMATDGAFKLVQYGTGEQVPAQLFNLSADEGENNNLLQPPGNAAAAAVAARLDALLRAQIDYPSVARDIAKYQHEQFVWWTSNQTDWRKEIASGDVRWQKAWAAHPAEALAAAEAYLASNGTTIFACDGRLANI